MEIKENQYMTEVVTLNNFNIPVSELNRIADERGYPVSGDMIAAANRFPGAARLVTQSRLAQL